MYFLYCIKLKYKILNSYAGVTEFFFWCLTVMTHLSAFVQAYREPYHGHVCTKQNSVNCGGYERRVPLSKGNCFRSTERAIVIKLLPTQLK